jgi:hypothetical protein
MERTIKQNNLKNPIIPNIKQSKGGAKDIYEDEDDDEREERLNREYEATLSKVDSSVTKFYNIDIDNALKFKKAYYERPDGMIDSYDIYIDYNNAKAKIFKIKKRNNKIFSIKIMTGAESTEISRRKLMIDGHPVDNRSIINKIIEVELKNKKSKKK